MHVSEIMGTRAAGVQMRRVGVEYPPEERSQVMSSAVRLYRELGVDVEVEGQVLFVSCGKGMAGPLMGLLERSTGHRGFNEWWDDTSPQSR